MKQFSALFLILVTLCIPAIAQGQDAYAKFGKYTMVDQSFMECVYEHCTYDPYLDKTQIVDEILEIGKKASRYGDYNKYKRDSIIRTDYPNGIKISEFDRLSRKYRSSLTEMVRYPSHDKLDMYDRIFGDAYHYAEDIPEIKWSLHGDTDEICGHICRKATATFRGREWIAWFAESIPIDNGPWKFNGLPGLILKIEDTKKEHVFEALQIRKSNKAFGYKVPSLLIPTDRKTFNKMMHDYRMDAANFLNGLPNQPKASDGQSMPHRRLFYNPIEKD